MSRETAGKTGHARAIHRRNAANVGLAERVASTALGASLFLSGVGRRGIVGWTAAAIGSALAAHGLRRHSRLYDQLGITDADAGVGASPLSREVHSHSAVTIQAPPATVYGAWRDTAGLQRFFPHVSRIEELDRVTSRWTAVGPPGRAPEWDAIIVEDVEGQRIAWRSLEGSAFEHAGVITFEPAPAGRGTRVRLELRSRPPGGVLGVLAAKTMGADPASEASEALRRFKQWMESGEIASAAGPAARDEGWARSSLREEVLERTLPVGRRAAGRERVLGRAAPDEVEEASMESFPASDAPAFNARYSTPRGTERPGLERASAPARRGEA